MFTTKNEPDRMLEVSEEFYSQETNLIHLSYEKRPFVKGGCAPLYHNFIYAYILLKTKQRPNMEKAMHLLERLLHFQTKRGEPTGNFPRYIHEYPYSERKFEIVDILLPLYRIYNEFALILPKELKTNLKKSIYAGVLYLKNLMEKGPYSYLFSLQIYSLLKVYGALFKENLWEQEGHKKLSALLEKGPDKSWGSTRHLSKMLLYLSLFSDQKDSMYLEPFSNFLSQSWHKNLSIYGGAGLNEHVFRDTQEKTIYHYFMDKSASLLGADLMEASLLDLAFEPSIQKKSKLSYNLEPFEIYQEFFDHHSSSFFNLNKDLWEKRGGFYPFKLMLLNNQRVDSFVLQMGAFTFIEQLEPNKFIFTFENDLHSDLDISFFGNLSSNMQLLSNGKKATMFDLSSPLEFLFEHFKLIMTFPNLKPNRGLWAQLLRDNRRSQMVSQFNHTYDWHLYLRKTSKDDDAPIQVQMELIELA